MSGIQRSSISAREFSKAYLKTSKESFNPTNFNPRILEADVAIICSSMPALASFSKPFVTKWRYIASLQDRIASYLAVSKTKLVASKTMSSSSPQQQQQRSQNHDDDDDDRSETVSRLHMVSQYYSKLHEDTPDTSKGSFGGSIFTTDIHAASCGGDLEEGVIMESLSVEQVAHMTHAAADQL